MAHVIKRDGKQQMSEVRSLLMEWDLLGVADVPWCADEYDCMIGPLLRHLHDGGDAATLHDWITREVVDHFGLTPNAGANKELAETLVSWWGRHHEAPSS